LRAHLAQLARAAEGVLQRGGAASPVRTAQALKAAIAGAFGYDGDRETYDDLANADLASVIARRRGLPVALGILYIETARRIGARAHGLNFPRHFLVAIHGTGGAAVIDPFHGGDLLDADALQALLPPGEELDTATHLQTMRDDDVLLRLCNNVLGRTRDSDPARFRRTLEAMLQFCPAAGWLWYELAQAHDRAGLEAAAAQAAAKAAALDPAAPWRLAALDLARAAQRSLN
jgi:regulator of sirC expression with transglutaminase-like and TPR domain